MRVTLDDVLEAVAWFALTVAAEGVIILLTLAPTLHTAAIGG